MKKLLLFLISFCITNMLLAQVPQGINYQAIIRDNSGQIQSEKEVEINFKILQESLEGKEVFSEIHYTKSNSQGIINLILGSVNTETFESINWSNGPFFMSIKVNDKFIGTSQILSVPYALYANSAGNVFSGDFNDLINVPENIDIDYLDDFSGDFNHLSNIPVNLDTDSSDDFSGNFNDLTNIPENLDLDSSDDFDGNFNSLSNVPINLDTDYTDDFSGDFNNLINVPEKLDMDYLDDFSGDFNHLSNIPVNLDTDNTDDFSGNFNDLTNIPENLDLDSSDDFNGDYNRLTNKPNYSFFWGDKDQDGFGDTYKAIYAPEAPNGYIDNNEDCNDDNDQVYPGADEICDMLDNDCDGEIDEDAINMSLWYFDSDNDGFGDGLLTIESCFKPEGYVENSNDCDDTNPEVNPAAEEVCDELDNNCNGIIDDNSVDAVTWYQDLDSDGFGNPDIEKISCAQPTGFVDNNNDCDDTDPSINPASAEFCDGVDNDCDGYTDENAVDGQTWYADNDGDGYGNNYDMIEACEQPDGYVNNNNDCDDNNHLIFPGANEFECSMVDYNCDGHTATNGDICDGGAGTCLNGACLPDINSCQSDTDCSNFESCCSSVGGVCQPGEIGCTCSPICLMKGANTGQINDLDKKNKTEIKLNPNSENIFNIDNDFNFN